MLKINARGTGALAAAVAVTTMAVGAAHAQTDWPNRTVTMVLPYAAGGGADPVARVVAEGLTKRLGQSFVVDFRPGGNATIGTAAMLQQPADGYTILFTPPTPVITVKFMMNDLQYEPETALIPVIKISDSPTAIMAHKDFAPKTLKEYIEYAKAHPGEVNVGVPSLGGGGHLVAVMLDQEYGVKLNVVPYKGTGTLMPDILAGRLQASQDFPAAYVPQLPSGNVRVIAVTSSERVPALPDVPTSTEAGYPNLKFSAWYGVFAKTGTPDAIVEKLNKSINEVLQDPEVRKKIESLAYVVGGGTVAEFQQTYKDDFVRLKKVIVDGNIKLQ